MRRVLVVGVATLFLLAGAGVARANHTHVLILPNGKCAILAAEGNEKYLILPEVLFSNNPNVDADDAAGGLEGLPLNRRHPLHVLVHLGVPGADGGHRGDGLGPGSVRRDGRLCERIAATGRSCTQRSRLVPRPGLAVARRGRTDPRPGPSWRPAPPAIEQDLRCGLRPRLIVGCRHNTI